MAFKAITANRLSDGIAVWLAEAGQWTTHFDRAVIAQTSSHAALLEEIAAEAVAACDVVDALTIDVVLEEGRPAPKKLKERIRALGPTVRRDLGKQAENAADVERAA